MPPSIEESGFFIDDIEKREGRYKQYHKKEIPLKVFRIAGNNNKPMKEAQYHYRRGTGSRYKTVIVPGYFAG